MLAREERRIVAGELKALEGTLERPEMLKPPTMTEKAESSEAMLDGPRMFKPPTVEDEGE